MPTSTHIKKHFAGSEIVRDVVIGMADGLTVPFALAAGLSGAVSSTSTIVTAGSAEIAAEAICRVADGWLDLGAIFVRHRSGRASFCTA